MNSIIKKDYERFTPNKFSVFPFVIRYIRNHELRYIYWGRIKAITSNPILRRIASMILTRYRRLYGLELNFKRIGGGIRLIHPWCITMNDNAIVGENVTLFKGVTIGVIEHGQKKGNPTIGNNVIIYANATVCGKVVIGDGAIIAAGSFVNFDVPPHAIVIGNPGVIHLNNKLSFETSVSPENAKALVQC